MTSPVGFYIDRTYHVELGSTGLQSFYTLSGI
jgi:hypothetical protein